MRTLHGYQLYLKYHKSVEATTLSSESYKNIVREEASLQDFDINNVEHREGEDYSCTPVHWVITNVIDAETKSELLIALGEMILK